MWGQKSWPNGFLICYFSCSPAPGVSLRLASPTTIPERPRRFSTRRKDSSASCNTLRPTYFSFIEWLSRISPFFCTKSVTLYRGYRHRFDWNIAGTNLHLDEEEWTMSRRNAYSSSSLSFIERRFFKWSLLVNATHKCYFLPSLPTNLFSWITNCYFGISPNCSTYLIRVKEQKPISISVTFLIDFITITWSRNRVERNSARFQVIFLELRWRNNISIAWDQRIHQAHKAESEADPT